MKPIAILGCGYVGLVVGACLAELGHRVVCCDTDGSVVDRLKRGETPFYEPGLPELIRAHVSAGRLAFTADSASAIAPAALIFIAVGTPMGTDGEADVSAVMEASAAIGQAISPHAVVVVKSTVPVGTAQRVENAIRLHTDVPFDVVSNPEFLREGTAIADFMRMERAVIGASSQAAGDALQELYAPLNIRVVRTGRETAELIKYASNAYLATKISFMNNMANLCERLGADVAELAQGVGLDSRIGAKYLEAGIGYGGSCFPKDVQALLRMSESVQYDFGMLKSVIRTNQEQPLRFMEKVESVLGDLNGLSVAVLGLSFKPGTDDMRSAPSVPIVRFLLERGAAVRAYDPQAARAAEKVLGIGPLYTDKLEEAVAGCDACVVVTEWPEIASVSLPRLRALMRKPVLFDGRNVFSPDEMRGAGFDYYPIGRPPVTAALNGDR